MVEGNTQPYNFGIIYQQRNHHRIHQIQHTGVLNKCFSSPKGCKSNCEIIHKKNLKSWEHIELLSESGSTKNYGINARHIWRKKKN
ncbi:unnamed protein product [Caenorhabditis nigoni]